VVVGRPVDLPGSTGAYIPVSLLFIVESNSGDVGSV
jgi:hypothetical protein